jgi:5-methyltetrahydrofolate--homocysteine methyltransferase
MAHLLDLLNDRILLCDGGMGSLVQAMNLDADADYRGHENCTDILTLSRPDAVREIHDHYLAAGADMITTNTFGASPVTLGEFGIADEARLLNQRAAELARDAIAAFSGDGRQRFVMGDVGPGTKLPSLGHIDYRSLEDALTVQCEGLVAGGADAILIETCQDPLQLKAAVNGAKRARGASDLPILAQVTVETTGTLLVGADIAAVATIAQALDLPLLGVNCATGPQEMAEHVKWLGENWPGLIAVQPNAGLPELVDGETVYPLNPDQLAKWLERFIEEDGINMVGGCCGTVPAHIAAVDAMLRGRATDTIRPAAKKRTVHWVPAVASLYTQVPLRQENAFFSIGERCNANGSKKFRQLQEAGDWDGCVAMGREQVKEGSNALDVCTAFVGRDEVADMARMIEPMRGAVTAPLVIDSTELEVLEHALELYGGKAIINSINFEAGEEAAAQRLQLARRFGAAVIALTIDEDGMAKDVEGKLRIARRLHDFACVEHGLPASDLLIDPLTFTVCTGNADDRRLALETLDAIERIGAELPECQIILGVSNVSFGLKPAARHVLNSVFLDHALKRGMTGAIVHVSKIMALHKIPENERKAAEDLIFARFTDDYDPLHTFLDLFSGRTAATAVEKPKPATVEEALGQRIVDGDRQGLGDDLAQALKTHAPTDIINEILLDGMKIVGELFASGQMQLPFVLQSAETMKAAVAYLEPFMDKADSRDKGTIVLATVRGDVHDIGKNLVDIILTNNGYNVVNLGIKQPIQNIVSAIAEHAADAVGMSGLLVKSTSIMRENLEEMTRQGLDLPVFLGGAALTRKYVETDCVNAYGSGRVAYGRDAFGALSLMNAVMNGDFAGHAPVKTAAVPTKAEPPAPMRPVDWDEVRTKRADLHADIEPPAPPFWGARVIENVAPKALLPFLNETMLYRFHWGYKKQGLDHAAWKEWAAAEVRPILHDLMDRCAAEAILAPQAVYGYWKCASEGDSVVLFEDDGTTERTRFAFPRQRRAGGVCIADFFRPIDDGERDVIGLQVVTMGQRASEEARRWFAEDRYQDYLYLHGLSVEIAEALAEYVHKRIRGELGFGHLDERRMSKLLKQGYRGSRYSFGYPACPDMADQRKLLDLLDAERIGVVMAEEHQLHPEQSTSAIVVHHPQAKYFSV